MKVIEVLISTDGTSTVTTKGFAGPTCREASQLLESALGSRLGEQLTGEYHSAEQPISIQERQRP